MPVLSNIDLARYYAHVGSETAVRNNEIISADLVFVTTAAGAEPRETARLGGDGGFQLFGAGDGAAGAQIAEYPGFPDYYALWLGIAPHEVENYTLYGGGTIGDIGVNFKGGAGSGFYVYEANSHEHAGFLPIANGGGLRLGGLTSGTHTIKAPAVSGGFTSTFQNSSGTVAYLSDITGGGVSDGDKGDITVASSGTVWTVDNDAITTAKLLNSNVTLAKLANVADATILGNNTGGAAAPVALTAAQTKTLLSLGNVENTALSTWAGTTNITTLGTIATGTWNGTDVAVADGGTGRSTSTTAYGLLAAGTTATGAHQTLAAGATTELLVGGGAAALPVWTTATGTGAPVRAGSPTLTGSAVADILAVNALNLSSGDKIRFDDGAGNEYSLFRNASNDIELRRNIGGAAQQGFLFSSGYLGLTQTVRTSLGQSTAGFSDIYIREDGVAAGVGVDTLRLVAPAIAANTTVTLPAVTGTLPTLAGTETFTNKTYEGVSINLTLNGGAAIALPTNVVGQFARTTAASATPNIVSVVNGGNAGAYAQYAEYTRLGALKGALRFDGTLGTAATGWRLIADDTVYPLFYAAGSAVDDVYYFLDRTGGLTQFAVRGSAAATRPSTVDVYGKVGLYNNIATAGSGVGPIYSESISATQTANFTAASYTPPATAGRYRVGATITTTSATNTGTLQVTVDYRDSQGTVHTADILGLAGAAGTSAASQTSVASKEFHTVAFPISINNAATAIVLKVVITGTVSYTVAPYIEQLG